MSKVPLLAIMIGLGFLSVVVDSVSYSISVLTDGIFIGLMVGAVYLLWPEKDQG